MSVSAQECCEHNSEMRPEMVQSYKIQKDCKTHNKVLSDACNHKRQGSLVLLLESEKQPRLANTPKQGAERVSLFMFKCSQGK